MNIEEEIVYWESVIEELSQAIQNGDTHAEMFAQLREAQENLEYFINL